MPGAQIQASERPLYKIFSSDYLFTVPRYQRPYSWGPEQAEQLLDDLLDALHVDDRKPVDDLDPYFLGSIVLIKGDDSAAEVVDGQQRLTTLTIMLAALRDTLTDPEMRRSVTDRLYAAEDPFAGIPAHYRLRLRPSDEEYFRKHIQDGVEFTDLTNVQISDSQRNIHNNYLLLKDRLEKTNEPERKRLATFLARRCYLVVVTSSDSSSAFRIFSILNDRGVDLSHSDILKAEVIGAAAPPLSGGLAQEWEAAEDALGQSNFRDLFTHIRMAFHPSKLRSTVLEEIRIHLRPTADPARFVREIVTPYSQAFGIVLNADGTGQGALPEEVRGPLTWLGRVDNQDWIPAALHFMVENGENMDAWAPYLRDLERLAFALMITRTYVNARIARYGQVIEAVRAHTDLANPGSPLQLSAAERQDVLEHLDGPLYESAKVRLPVLLRLDEALASGGASYRYKVLSIEHVLPQNPAEGGQWATWFPDDEERTYWTHRLANLVLLSRQKNSQASNWEFEVKKRKYFSDRYGTSPFAITTQVLQKEVWTPTTLSERQRDLIERLRVVWRL